MAFPAAAAAREQSAQRSVHASVFGDCQDRDLRPWRDGPSWPLRDMVTLTGRGTCTSRRFTDEIVDDPLDQRGRPARTSSSQAPRVTSRVRFCAGAEESQRAQQTRGSEVGPWTRTRRKSRRGQALEIEQSGPPLSPVFPASCAEERGSRAAARRRRARTDRVAWREGCASRAQRRFSARGQRTRFDSAIAIALHGRKRASLLGQRCKSTFALRTRRWWRMTAASIVANGTANFRCRGGEDRRRR